MNVTTAGVILALLGSGIVGGVFFAFSSFIIKALVRVPSPEGIAAMQSINVAVLNPSFLGLFLGTTVISLVVGALAVMEWDTPSAPLYLAGALLYVIGTFLVTGLGNVPLNEQLAAVSSNNPKAIAVWEHYIDRWTMLNTIRTAAAIAAALMFVFGLMQSGDG